MPPGPRAYPAMAPPVPPTPHPAHDAARRVLAFAHEALGPAGEELLSDAARQARVLSRLRAGLALADAVLAEVHRAASETP